VTDQYRNPANCILLSQRCTHACEPTSCGMPRLTYRFQSPVEVFGFFYLYWRSNIVLSIGHHWRYFVIVCVWCIGRSYNQNKKHHAASLIQQMRVNGVLVIFCLASSVLWVAICCRHSQMRYRLPLKAREKVRYSLPNLESVCQCCINHFRPYIMVNQSAIQPLISIFTSFDWFSWLKRLWTLCWSIGNYLSC